jgi:hypothetical protein
VKPANIKEHRIDRRFARNQNGKRRVVVVIRERGGQSNGDQVSRVAALAIKRGKSVDFTGYWQRHIAE